MKNKSDFSELLVFWVSIQVYIDIVVSVKRIGLLGFVVAVKLHIALRDALIFAPLWKMLRGFLEALFKLDLLKLLVVGAELVTYLLRILKPGILRNSGLLKISNRVRRLVVLFLIFLFFLTNRIGVFLPYLF